MSSAEQIDSVLVLGGGDGLAAREILKYPAVAKIQVVDLDPSMTNLAKDLPLLREVNHDSFRNPKVKITNEDAFSFVRSNKQKFDVVIADLVDPADEKTSKLYSQEMYQAIREVLKPGGVFITQAGSTFFTPRAFWIINNTVTKGFAAKPQPLYVNVPSFGEWGFVTASDKPLSFAERPLPTGLIIDSATLKRSSTMPPELTNHRNDTVNTLFSPKLYSVYQSDMKLWNY